MLMNHQPVNQTINQSITNAGINQTFQLNQKDRHRKWNDRQFYEPTLY